MGGGYRAQRGEILELCFLVSIDYFKSFASALWLTETENRILKGPKTENLNQKWPNTENRI